MSEPNWVAVHVRVKTPPNCPRMIRINPEPTRRTDWSGRRCRHVKLYAVHPEDAERVLRAYDKPISMYQSKEFLVCPCQVSLKHIGKP